MIAADVQLRCDDGHPIFDVRTGKRVNVSRSISVGDHVWLGLRSVVLGGVEIGSGSVVGVGSIVTRDVPNNVVAAGSPAKPVRRDIAWERPHLTMTRPFQKPDSSTVRRSEQYWNLTRVDAEPTTPTSARVRFPFVPRRLKRRLRKLIRRA
jgi:hypothetical protein